ncbi:Nucleolar protein 56 [Echinococcus granulosus]|uniref:Nucleolar protein 56 n=1 Tax=Echinococcus granulosus TaxID=6210 RepID=A0A068WGJ9_ECHGR|nr:Nucleolar protein 56 [Echinococcus granulosus]CDS18869.1 nucleolar protein 56 [Echinococcus granulosus]
MKSRVLFLFEHASGYAILGTKLHELSAVVERLSGVSTDYDTFSGTFKLRAFSPFTSAENALENCNSVSEGIVHDDLRNFLLSNLKGEKPVLLCVSEHKLADAIKATETGLPGTVKISSESAAIDIYRGIREFFSNYIAELTHFAESQAQVGLGHSYSRAKVKFNVNRDDNMVIQTISLLDQMDKDINTFSMRIKEWFSYHFPELAKIVPESTNYIKLVNIIRSREDLTEDKLGQIEKVIHDHEKAVAILEVAKTSMGFDVTDQDVENLSSFAKIVQTFMERRAKAYDYLVNKLTGVAPNLNTLIGSQVAARLISHAGSLINLSKFPASTIQILGAEKALFRALRTRGRTPKYGLIFHSSYIGRAAKENKGRISRFLAAKCALATRIDCFSDILCDVYGQHLKKQVEDRLKYFESGVMPITNAEAMAAAVKEANRVIGKLKKRAVATLNGTASPNINCYTKDNGNEAQPVEKKTKKKKRKSGLAQLEETAQYKEVGIEQTREEVGEKKKKKQKQVETVEDVRMDGVVEPPRKKKKKNEAENGGREESFEADASIVVEGKKKKKKHEIDV